MFGSGVRIIVEKPKNTIIKVLQVFVVSFDIG